MRVQTFRFTNLISTIPAERLDTLWLPLDGFNLGLPHRHASRLVGDGFKKN